MPQQKAQLPPGYCIHTAETAQLDTKTMYELLALRAEVFVVEQNCAYLDPDGRDLEPTCETIWATDPAGVIVSCARILHDDAKEPGLRSIGRVATATAARGKGVASAVFSTAIARCQGHPIHIHAQSYLRDWYASFGFVQQGEEYEWDGIPHIDMRREATAA